MTSVLFAVTGVDRWTLADGSTRPSGYWPEEVAVPHRIFTDAGVTITIGTPAGVPATADAAGFDPQYHGGSRAEADRVRTYLDAIEGLRSPQTLETIDVDAYDLIFVPGGWGPMEDLAVSTSFGELVAAFTAAGKPVAAVCHGPAALLPARAEDGSWLFAGRAVTGFSNEEERQVGFAEQAAWLVEDRLREEGGRYRAAADEWAEHVVVDGNLYTGQNPASAAGLARRLLVDAAAGRAAA